MNVIHGHLYHKYKEITLIINPAGEMFTISINYVHSQLHEINCI